MSDDSTAFNFSKLVPGFDFLQSLGKGAASTAINSLPSMPQLPQIGSWIAPTLSVEELDKRITDLKAVQFWLDQNALALKATIQALEVQKMTLATLKGMNFSMGELASAFKLKTPAPEVASPAPPYADLASPPSASPAETSPPPATATKAPSAPAAGVVDPLQWWGALTQQFQQIASTAMQDAAKQTAIDTSKNLASGIAKGALQSAGQMTKQVTKQVTQKVARTVAKRVRTSPAPAPVAPAATKLRPKTAATPFDTAMNASKKIAEGARSAWTSALSDLKIPMPAGSAFKVAAAPAQKAAKSPAKVDKARSAKPASRTPVGAAKTASAKIGKRR